MPGDLTHGKEKGIVLTCPGMQNGDGYPALDTIGVLPRRVEMVSNPQHNRDFSPQSGDDALDTIGVLARRAEIDALDTIGVSARRVEKTHQSSRLSGSFTLHVIKIGECGRSRVVHAFEDRECVGSPGLDIELNCYQPTDH